MLCLIVLWGFSLVISYSGVKVVESAFSCTAQLQEEVEALETKVSETRDKIQRSQSNSRLQREEKAELLQRISQAEYVLAATTQEAARMQPHAAPTLSDSTTVIRVYTNFQNIQGNRRTIRKRPIDSFRAHCPLFVDCLLYTSPSPRD